MQPGGYRNFRVAFLPGYSFYIDEMLKTIVISAEILPKISHRSVVSQLKLKKYFTIFDLKIYVTLRTVK